MLTSHFEYISHFYHTNRKYISKHNHSCYELVYYCNGTGETCFDNKRPLFYSPNHYVIYQPYDYHTETHYSDSFVYCIGFNIDSKHPLRPNRGIYHDADCTILPLVEKLSSEVIEKMAFYDFAAESLLNQILITHQRSYSANHESIDAIQYIIKFIDENFTQNINLSLLCEMSGYSYDYFRHLFKEKVGISPKTYILNKQISHAKQLLIKEQMPVSQVAERCGFSNSSQFNVIFKKQVGMSPLQFKKEHFAIQQSIINFDENE